MKIYTGNFANIKKYTNIGLFPISIALSARYFSGVSYRPLNPDRSFLNDQEIDYIPKYNKKLINLNIKDVLNDIEKLSNGKNVVLLCHESAGSFCHRRLVAEWITKETGQEVKELGKMEDESLF